MSSWVTFNRPEEVAAESDPNTINMIKFRYKRKEPANNSGSPSSNTVKSTNSKSVEIKSNDIKDDSKYNSLKRETSDSKSKSQLIKTKTSSEQEYMDGCIRAIVVSA